MTPEQEAILRATCEPVFGGFYYTRGERDFLPDAVLNSPEAAAAAVGYVITPDGPLLAPIAGSWWFPISDRRFTPLGNSGRGLNDFLNRVLGYPDYADARYPAIDPWSEEEGYPEHAAELVNALLNVRTWRISGAVEGQGFEATVAAGTAIRDWASAVEDDWDEPPTRRSAYGFGYSFHRPGAVLDFAVALGRIYIPSSPRRPSEPQAEYNTVMVAMPTVALRAAGEAGRATTTPKSSYGPGTSDSRARLCGADLLTLPEPPAESHASFSLDVRAETWWTADDEWFTLAAG